MVDAKYKSEAKGTTQVFVAEDMEKMGYYSTAIRWKVGGLNQRLRHIVSSAYILYPGDVFEHDADDPVVGAIPLVPQTTRAREVYAVVQDLLRNAQVL